MLLLLEPQTNFSIVSEMCLLHYKTVFEVDKKFQRISIAFVKFYVINDLKKYCRSIWSLFESIAIYRVTTIKNLHIHSAPASYLHTVWVIFNFDYKKFLLTKSLILHTQRDFSFQKYLRSNIIMFILSTWNSKKSWRNNTFRPNPI